MSFPARLLGDLVEKRLLPVVVLALVALVALPLWFGRGTTASPVAAQAAPVDSSDAQLARARIALVTSTMTVRPTWSGRTRDPFSVQPASRKKAAGGHGSTSTTTTPAATAAPGSLGGTAPTSSTTSTTTTPTPSGTTSTTSTTTTTTSPTTTTGSGSSSGEAGPAATFHVDARFGPVGSQPAVRRDIPREQAFPSPSLPAATFIGVRADRRTAVFVLLSGVHATGTATCRPTPANCLSLEATAGQRATLTYADPAGGAHTWLLEVLHIRKTEVDARTARTARARISARGKAALGARMRSGLTPGLGRYRYDALRGLVVPTPPATPRGDRWRLVGRVGQALGRALR